MTIAIGQDPGCFTAKAVVNELDLFRSPVVDVDCFEEAAFFDAVLGRDMFTGKTIFLGNPAKMPARRMFFEMVEDQRLQLVFEFHFQWPVAFGLKHRRRWNKFDGRFIQFFK